MPPEMRPGGAAGPVAGAADASRAAMACAEDGRPDRRAGPKDERIRVVEDEVLVSMLVEDELRGAGAAVLGPVPTVGDALRLVEAAAADGGIGAAVLDINLDGQRVAPVCGAPRGGIVAPCSTGSADPRTGHLRTAAMPDMHETTGTRERRRGAPSPRAARSATTTRR